MIDPKDTRMNEGLDEAGLREAEATFGATGNFASAILAYLRASTIGGEPVALRELTWKPVMPDSTTSVAETPFGEYSVAHYTEADGDGWEVLFGDNEVIGYRATEDEGKALATTDLLHRIRSALE